MNRSHATGLGEPELTGKRALFQPPPEKVSNTRSRSDKPPKAGKSGQERPANSPKHPPRRVRITTELTGRALTIVQNIQGRHRLKTGRVLPLWKAVSQAIEYYGDSQAERNS